MPSRAVGWHYLIATYIIFPWRFEPVLHTSHFVLTHHVAFCLFFIIAWYLVDQIT